MLFSLEQFNNMEFVFGKNLGKPIGIFYQTLGFAV
jgi:hypothetical protein